YRSSNENGRKTRTREMALSGQSFWMHRKAKKCELLFAGGSRAANLLGDPGALARASAEIIELGAAHRTLAADFDGLDGRGVQREDPLDAFAERQFPHG